MPASPDIQTEGVLRVVITSAGRSIPESMLVESVVVRRAFGSVPMARLVLADGDMTTGTWEASDGDTFAPGAEVTIEAGYGDQSRPIFSGVVVRVGLRIDGENHSRLDVECRDKSVRLTVGRRNAHWLQQADSDIIAAIASAHGLQAEVEATQPQHAALTQYYCSDWDFVIARAEANGLLVDAADGKLAVRAPASGGDAVLAVTWGQDLIEFDAEIDARSQVASVIAAAWDPASQAVLTAEQSPLAVGAQGNLDGATLAQVVGLDAQRLQSAAALDAAMLGAWAKGQQRKAGLARIRGRMCFQGSALAIPGALIELAGLGARYNGTVLVTAVEHELADGNWLTHARFGMSAEWFCERTDVVAPAAAGWLPGAEGLQIGVVTKVDGDPEGQARIQVRLPVLDAAQPAVWARLMQFHASSGFGACFVPEIDDEVVIAFLNHDPSHPVVLGSLYSSRHAPPYVADAANTTKAVVTRCKHRLVFDEQDKVITLTTPGNNTLVLSDKDKGIELRDETGNVVQMRPGGVTITSPKDVSISAKGKISLDAVGPVSIESKADVTAKGLNVGCQAQVAFTGKGSASAELSAAGQVTVRGAMVLIN